jgi:hypothetical protein
MEIGVHSASIAWPSHGVPHPVDVSYLPHLQPSRIRVMNHPATSLYQWRDVGWHRGSVAGHQRWRLAAGGTRRHLRSRREQS